MRTPTNSVLLAILLLSACNPIAEKPSDVASTSSLPASSSKSSIRETKNVSYKGTVKPAGISIYMEGTHRLALDDGRFILLESDTLDLNGYVNEKVEVFGSIRPTVESDAVIMRIEEITLTSPKTSSSSTSTEKEELISESSVESSQNVSSESEGSSDSSTSTSTSTSSSNQEEVIEHSADFDVRIKKMSGEDFSVQKWSRKYCTGHIGFCVPVHANWYFQSFGATATDLWHVEMSSDALEKIHDGPIAVRLVSGSLASIGATDGQVVREGNIAIGYRSWTDARHFEILADSRIEEAVRYITDNLDVYTEE